MKRSSILLGFLIALAAFALVYAVQPTQFDERQNGFIRNARVRHVANSVTIYANEPRPLAQAARAVSNEYGWAVDYEDPPYFSKYDLVDDADPRWRKAHPNERVVGVAGGAFHTQFPVATSTSDEEHVLIKVVSDYNKSDNPGRYDVRNEDGRFAVVGVKVKDDYGREQSVRPVLDTPVTLPIETRNAYLTLESDPERSERSDPRKVRAGNDEPQLDESLRDRWRAEHSRARLISTGPGWSRRQDVLALVLRRG